MKPKVTNEQLQKCHGKGLSLSQTADKFGVTPQAVSQRWAAMGLRPHRPRRKPTGRVVKHWTVDSETIDKVDAIAKIIETQKGMVIDQAVDRLYEKTIREAGI